MMSRGPERQPQEPRLDEPYESLVSWQGAASGASDAEQTRARLQVLLTRDLTRAITTFRSTTTYLNWILIALTAALVFLGVIQLLLLRK